jgi:7-carboxy-7-deazaguanine synthase
MPNLKTDAQLPLRDGGVEPSGAPARSTPAGTPSRCDDPSAAGGAASQLLPQTAGYAITSDLASVGDSPSRMAITNDLAVVSGQPSQMASRFSSSSTSNALKVGNPLPADTGAELTLSQLRITEIFYSLQGETSRVGLPTVFIRLTGCPLRCTYCDTAYAFTGGQSMSLADILRQVAAYAPRYVTVTGGEPLAQKNSLLFLKALCDAGYQVSLETSGALDISEVDARVMRVVDIKTPASGEAARNRWESVALLTMHDEIKFVLCDEKDYHWAKQIIRQYHLDEKCPVLFSPAHGALNATQLAEWILRDQLPVRMQVQLHKLLWNNAPGH